MLFAPKNFRNKEELLQAYLNVLQGTDPLKVCYVSGPISAKNGNTTHENIGKLNYWAAKIDEMSEYDVVIDPSAVGDLEARGYSRKDALWVWTGLLRSELIGIIIMIPRWQKSKGASIERLIALEQGLKIIYL